jgi:hypothetical protein
MILMTRSGQAWASDVPARSNAASVKRQAMWIEVFIDVSLGFARGLALRGQWNAMDPVPGCAGGHPDRRQVNWACNARP